MGRHLPSHLSIVIIFPDKTILHIKFLDLEFVFRLIIKKNEYGFWCSIINDSLAKNIDLDTEELFELAKKTQDDYFLQKQ